MIIKESFQVFKKNFFKLVLTDFVFLALLISFLIYAKVRLKGYIAIIDQFSPMINSLQTADIVKLSSVLDSLNIIVQKSLFFIYLVIPIIIFLLFYISQSLFYYFLDKKVRINYFFKFLLLLIPFFILFVLIIKGFIGLMLGFVGYKILTNLLLKFILYSILLFFSLYFLLIFYSLFGEKVNEIAKKGFLIGVKRFYLLLPLFLLFFIFLIALFWSLVEVYVMYFSGLISFILILRVLLLIVVIDWFKVFFKLIIDKY